MYSRLARRLARSAVVDWVVLRLLVYIAVALGAAAMFTLGAFVCSITR